MGFLRGISPTYTADRGRAEALLSVDAPRWLTGYCRFLRVLTYFGQLTEFAVGKLEHVSMDDSLVIITTCLDLHLLVHWKGGLTHGEAAWPSPSHFYSSTSFSASQLLFPSSLHFFSPLYLHCSLKVLRPTISLLQHLCLLYSLYRKIHWPTLPHQILISR